ncbi:MAG: queuine tRNA-ribosyltransferase family protein [Chloroflexota bacterium]
MVKKKSLSLPNGQINFPAFLPDGTKGVVRTVDAADLRTSGTQGVVMNTFHLMQKPGSSTITALGGLHKMSGWSGPILTDSGGFQAYSIIRENTKNGTLNDKGILFRREGGRKYHLTPEKTIQLQVNYGADIIVTLDDCTHVDADQDVQQTAVKRTVAWGKRCKAEFEKLMSEKGQDESQRPKIFAVVQGGGDKALRKACADELLAIGFDGFGYGGWPLDSEGNLLEEILGYTRDAIPLEFPMHALGVGHPKNVLTCHHLGYEMFDSALPTRDARRGRLYTFSDAAGLTGDWFQFLYIYDDKHIKINRPISAHCDCTVCQKYSRGYLHHLFKINDHLFFRLATLHNLRFMHLLENRMRELH